MAAAIVAAVSAGGAQATVPRGMLASPRQLQGQAGAAVPSLPPLWATEITSRGAVFLKPAFAARMRRAGINAVVVDPTRMTFAQLKKARAAAVRDHLRTVLVLPGKHARPTRSVRSARAACAAKHSRIRLVCAVSAPSLAIARRLVSRGRGQLAVVRSAGPVQFRRAAVLRGSRDRLLALTTLTADPAFRTASWKTAISGAVINSSVDLAVTPSGSNQQQALDAYLALLGTDSSAPAGTAGPPGPVENLRVVGVGTGTATVGWSAPTTGSPASSYTVTVDGGVAVPTGGATSATVDLSEACLLGRPSTIAVTAIDAQGAASTPEQISVMPTCSTGGGAGSPLNIALPIVSGTASVGSSLSTGDGLWTGIAPISLAYQWESCDATGAGCSPIGGATSATYRPVGPDQGHALRAVVTASNGGGSASATSAPTAVVSADSSPPTAPTGLAATGTTATSISVAWTAATDNVGVTGYTVYVNGNQVGTTGATSYALTGLACGTSYSIAVDAFDGAGNHSSRSSITASTGSCTDTTPPTAPTGLGATGATATSISVAWTAATDNVGVTGYTVYVNGNQVGTTAATAYAVNGLACGTSYSIAVDAFDGAGNHSSSTSISASTGGCGGGGAIANLWVATGGSDSGSNCKRFATQTAQPTASTVCATLARAYSLAACGDTIDVASGDYSGTDQFLKDQPSLDSCTSPVIIQAASGNRSDVVFGRILSESGYNTYAGGASWWTLQHVTVKQRIDVVQPSQHDTINDVDGGAFYVNGAQHLVIENSDWGPCWSDNSPSASHPCTDNLKVESGGGGAISSDIVIEHNDIHDFTMTTNHFECLAPWGGNNITIDANHFWNCDIYAIAPSSTGSGSCSSDPTWSGLVIENNWIGRVDGGGNQNGVGFQHGGCWTNSVIRYNSFSNSGIDQTSGDSSEVAGVTAIGNVGPAETCVPGMTYEYNVWVGSGTCGSSDIHVASLPYVNTSDQAAGDYHLAGAPGSTSADNFVPCTSPPANLNHDRDGDARPAAGSTCDAGADER
jgi:chitodextrinase